MFTRNIKAAKTPRTQGPVPAMPPFWELERLIGQGYAASDALAILAARCSQGPAMLPSSDRWAVGEREIRLSA
jgi:hypothetical protein